MVTIKEVLNRHKDIPDSVTVQIVPEGIYVYEPDIMWQGLIKNLPEVLSELRMEMFHTRRIFSNVSGSDDLVLERIIFEVPEEDFHVALNELVAELDLPFSDETEVTE